MSIINARSDSKSIYSTYDTYISYKNDIVKLIGLFLLSLFVVYFTNKAIIALFYLLLLPIIWKSKKDYFWFAYFFILINEPAGLFHSGAADQLNRLPLYRIGPGMAFTFYDFFLILTFFKAKKNKRRPIFLFKKPLFILAGYGIFLFFFSLAIGTSFESIIGVFRTIMFYTLFFSIPILIFSREDIYKFIHLIFPFTFLVVGGQFFEFVMGESLISYIDPSQIVRVALWQGNVRAVMEGVMIIFLSFIFSLYFIADRNYKGSKNFLYLVLILCIVSVIVSATRSWIGMFFIVLALYYLFVEKLHPKVILSLTAIIIIALLAYFQIPQFQSAVDVGISRFETVELIAKGDITAGGTLQRFDVRLPRVWEGFIQNPIIGWGISDVYWKYDDSHTGNFNLLLQVGLLGFSFWIFFWIYFYKKLSLAFTRFHKFQKPLKVLALGIIGMLILHFTSYQFFDYWCVYNHQLVFVILYLSFTNNLLQKNNVTA